MSYYKQHWFICCNQKADGKPCCGQHQPEQFLEYAKKQAKALGISGPGQIRVSKSGCLGRCEDGPWMVIYPEGRWVRCNSEAVIDAEISLALEGNGR